MSVYLAAPLPYPLKNACYGSDGNRLVVAGGVEEHDNGNTTYHDEVLVLEGIDRHWRTSTARLQSRRAWQSGVLVGDYLLCIGGRQERVGVG